MKLLLHIDQKASLLAGQEAPHSTEKIDFPIADIPTPLRDRLIPHYKPETGELTVWDRGTYVGVPTIALPITPVKVIESLDRLVQKIDECAAEVKRRQEAEKARQAEALGKAKEILAARETVTDQLWISETASYIDGIAPAGTTRSMVWDALRSLPEWPAWQAELEAENNRRKQEYLADIQSRKEQERQKIVDLLANYGDGPEQVEQFREGLLPEQAIAVALQKRFPALLPENQRESEDCDVVETAPLPAKGYQTLQLIRRTIAEQSAQTGAEITLQLLRCVETGEEDAEFPEEDEEAPVFYLARVTYQYTSQYKLLRDYNLS